MKKLLSVLLSVLIMLSLMPMSAMPVSAAANGNYNYTVSNGVASITGYLDKKSVDDIKIPSKLGGYPVEVIGRNAFSSCSATSITIPNSVTSINSGAFSYCRATSITIPDSVTYIGEGAFMECSALKELTIPFVGMELRGTENTHFSYIFEYKNPGLSILGGVPRSLKKVTITGGTRIENYAFSECSSIEEVVIKDNMKAISIGAFEYCTNLKSITIPKGVTDISLLAFYHCDLLTIKCYKNSQADSYANLMEIPVEYIDLNGVHVNNSGKTVLYRGGKAVTGTKVIAVGKYTYAIRKGIVQKAKRAAKYKKVKIGKSYYIVNAKGRVQKASKKAKYKIVRIRKVKYIVSRKGIVQLKKSKIRVGKTMYRTDKKGVAKKR